MPIPGFNKRGSLDIGIHQCTSKEFLERFCYGEKTLRSKYKEVIEQLLAFSISRGGKSIVFGGSFITAKEVPNDLDCMLILPNDKCCMLQTNELLSIEGCELDVVVVAETNKETIYNFLNLFSKNKLDLQVGLVEIVIDKLGDKSSWNDYEDYCSIESLLKAREAYIHRHVIKGIVEKKIFITILGLNEYIYFNYNVSPIISSSGWIFAPFCYIGESLVEDYNRFKIWINYIYEVYEADISVFADGIGTLLLGMYIKDELKSRKAYFDKVVLSKALLSSEFDWSKEINNNRVKRIWNLRSNQEDVITETISSDAKKHELYGNAYTKGFKSNNEEIIEQFYHYNGLIEWDEFQNNIFPIFHVSDLIQKNIEKEFMMRMQEIMNSSDTHKDL
jgi:hypothetical protein